MLLSKRNICLLEQTIESNNSRRRTMINRRKNYAQSNTNQSIKLFHGSCLPFGDTFWCIYSCIHKRMYSMGFFVAVSRYWLHTHKYTRAKNDYLVTSSNKKNLQLRYVRIQAKTNEQTPTKGSNSIFKYMELFFYNLVCILSIFCSMLNARFIRSFLNFVENRIEMRIRMRFFFHRFSFFLFHSIFERQTLENSIPSKQRRKKITFIETQRQI